MKKIAIVVIILAILYFVVGYICVYLDIFEQTQYNQIATIVGGVGSILGLFGLVVPSLKTSDIKSLEIDTLKSLTKAAEEIQKKEMELTTKQSDLSKLELQKQELEFLVKQASLSLFFREQLKRYYETLDQQITDNKEISRTLNEIKELEHKVEELNIEIEKSPNTESILKIIADARIHQKNKISETAVDIFLRLLKV